MKRISWIAIAVMIVLLPLGLVYTQDRAGISLNVIGIDSTDLAQVSINASILDVSGQLVSGLDVNNFSVGGELSGLASVTQVENVTDDDLAFASVLLIDTSSSMADRPLRQAKRAAAQYVNALRPNDPVAIVTFSSQVSVGGGLHNRPRSTASGDRTAWHTVGKPRFTMPPFSASRSPTARPCRAAQS